MKYLTPFFFLLLSISLYGQKVSEIYYSYGGGMEWYSEYYSIKVGDSYIEINDHGEETKQTFSISSKELNDLGDKLKSFGYYKVEQREMLDILDASSYSVGVYNYGIHFRTHSHRNYTTQEREIISQCAELIVFFCKEKLKE